jgi:hypothetical protein
MMRIAAQIADIVSRSRWERVFQRALDEQHRPVEHIARAAGV